MNSYDLIQPDNYTCTTNNVLVKIAKPEEVTQGGIIISSDVTGQQQHNNTIGTLIAFGEVAFTDVKGVKFQNTPQIGDNVVFPKYAGTTFEDKEGNLYRFFRDHEIMGFSNAR